MIIGPKEHFLTLILSQCFFLLIWDIKRIWIKWFGNYVIITIVFVNVTKFGCEFISLVLYKRLHLLYIWLLTRSITHWTLTLLMSIWFILWVEFHVALLYFCIAVFLSAFAVVFHYFVGGTDEIFYIQKFLILIHIYININCFLYYNFSWRSWFTICT